MWQYGLLAVHKVSTQSFCMIDQVREFHVNMLYCTLNENITMPSKFCFTYIRTSTDLQKLPLSTPAHRVPQAERIGGDHSQGQIPAPAGCHRTCTSGGYSWSCAGSHRQGGEEGTGVRIRYQRPPAVIEPAHQEVIAGHVQGPTCREGRRGP